MRKFFLLLSILVLITLVSAGVQQKIKDSNTKDLEHQEVAAIYSNYTVNI